MKCVHGNDLGYCEICAITESKVYEDSKNPKYIGKGEESKTKGEESKKYNIIKTKGDGFCGLYAIMFSYLCDTNKFLVNNKGESIDNIEKFIIFLTQYIEERKKKFPSVEEVDELINQLKNINTGTITSDILWVILTDILEVNIDIYMDDTEDRIIHNVIYRFINPKSTESIKIYGDRSHYSSIINSNFNFDNIPPNAKIWLNNMININYTKRLNQEHEKYITEYTKDTFIVKEINVSLYVLIMTTVRDNIDNHDFTVTLPDGSKRKSIKRKSIKRKSIKRKSIKLKSIKRKSIKRKSIKLKSIKRKSIKRKSIKRKSIKRNSIKRSSIKRSSISFK